MRPVLHARPDVLARIPSPRNIPPLPMDLRTRQARGQKLVFLSDGKVEEIAADLIAAGADGLMVEARTT